MTLTYGFYNAVAHDRVYDAIQMSSIFDGIIEDGVMSSIGSKLMVVEDSDMDINVGTGRAWFNHTWTNVDAIISLTIDTAHVTLPRIDAVVLEINAESATRANSIKIIKGTPATVPENPTLTNSGNVHQYALAYVYVGAGVTEITQANITNKVGTVDCPFVIAPISSVSAEELLVQWESEFYEWFDFVVNELSEEQFGNLQNQINDHDHSEVLNTKVVTNGLADLAVTKGKLAADSVDDSKIEYRVPKLKQRQGVSATNWDDGEGSSNNYTLTDVLMQVGVKNIIISNGNGDGTATITFPTAFSYIPLVFYALATSADCRGIIVSLSASQVQIKVYRTGTSGNIDVSIQWQAIGQG